RIELLQSLLLTLPGSPIVYYGDEIGMGDNVHLGDRAGVRTPMQWSPDRNAGFSTAEENTLYLPVITGPVHGYQTVNGGAQPRTPGFPPIREPPYVLSLAAHGYYWFSIERPDGADEPYGIERTAI